MPIDAVDLEVIKASLSGIVQEMQNSLFRTGFSTIVRESQDASCALMNAQGEIIAQHVVLPLHIGAFPACTAAVLTDSGLEVRPIEDFTGFPEILGGRVKTLHPKIFGGVLADDTRDDHARDLAASAIEAFDLVVVNLYPFEKTVAAGRGRSEVVEMIDVGGPAMIRAAAKNHARVAVVVDPRDYEVAVAQARVRIPSRTQSAPTVSTVIRITAKIVAKGMW